MLPTDIDTQLSSAREVNTAFWALHPEIPRQPITYGDGVTMYPAKTINAFAEFIDSLVQQGVITADLAWRVYLSVERKKCHH